MIGWYVHHVGAGHLHRMRCVTAHLTQPVTVLSSLPRPADWTGPWVELAPDETRAPVDQTAGGVLHWAPQHHPGILRRSAAVLAWLAEVRPSLVVVDVSVEVAVLVRTAGVPVVVAGMRGDRTDRAHRTAYDLATALLCPWPAARPEPGWPAAWHEKAWYVGALSRLDGHAFPPPPGDRSVAVLWGRGGVALPPDVLAEARTTTPGWTWTVLDGPDAAGALSASDIVVTHGGQNALAEVAAARRPAVVLPQPRPHGEQEANAAALTGIAAVRHGWPRDWPAALDEAVALGGEGWRAWSDGHGAQRAAEHLDQVSRELSCARP